MIKKYFLFITLIATCQVFSKEVYRKIEKNFNPYVCETKFGKSNLSPFNFFINSYYRGLTYSFNDVRCYSLFPCCNNSSNSLDYLIQSGFIGSTTYLRKGRTA
jgi:hypothetical protein